MEHGKPTAESMLKDQIATLLKQINDSKRHQRNHVSAMLLQGMLSNGPGVDRMWERVGGDKSHSPLAMERATLATQQGLAALAVTQADALIAELDKPVGAQ